MAEVLSVAVVFGLHITTKSNSATVVAENQKQLCNWLLFAELLLRLPSPDLCVSVSLQPKPLDTPLVPRCWPDASGSPPPRVWQRDDNSKSIDAGAFVPRSLNSTGLAG
eukprot:scaffold13633_cov64-Phaeocystis_antarctica.AAC.14